MKIYAVTKTPKKEKHVSNDMKIYFLTSDCHHLQDRFSK